MTLIAGLPAARLGDMAVCAGPPDTIVMGSSGCLIAGKPAARMGDQTAHGGVITLGCMTVLIGESGGGSAGSGAGRRTGAATAAPATMQALVMREAKASGKPFCEECARAAAVKQSRSAQADTLRAAKAAAVAYSEDC